MSVVAPDTRDAHARALRRLHADSAAYWASFATDRFLAPLGTAWAPAEHVRHLTLSMRAVTRGLRLPRPVLWLATGIARKPSRSYDALRARYYGALADGGQAGRFAPRPLGAVGDPDGARARIMAEHAAATDALLASLHGWSERALDRCRMPHPILGRLTVREMLSFTVYHNLHHVQVCARRAAEHAAAPTRAPTPGTQRGA